MPRIFDNIDQHLLSALQDTLQSSERADFCVGYFNLRGWQSIDSFIEKWDGGSGKCCRLLVGMQSAPDKEFRETMKLNKSMEEMDQKKQLIKKQQLAKEFKEQLTIGHPTNEDETGLRRLVQQLKAKKLIVKLFLRNNLHAKLYLLHKTDMAYPTIAYLGSSNLTISGLRHQGELNVDIVDSDAASKLSSWFEERWEDRWCVDISDELIKIIEESWAREELIPPYHIYIKMAYHLSQEARSGISEFKIPPVFGDKLFPYQSAAVRIAARHLDKRNGVLIGDVVGLGKTLMATALARIFEDKEGIDTLIICPKNLVKMWEAYREQYGLRGKVLSISKAIKVLPGLRRYKLVLIDESHNLRNRKGKTYESIHNYLKSNESKCILLTATPYNKTYIDLYNQLRLFVDDEQDIGIRPEALIKKEGEAIVMSRHQCSLRSLKAFENTEEKDDWRELMRLYMVRRTRSFIMDNYSSVECSKCNNIVLVKTSECPQCKTPLNLQGRKFLILENGEKSYFPLRLPRTVQFDIDEQYASLYDDDIVDIINHLNLPRYGLGLYVDSTVNPRAGSLESRILSNLSKAGRRLMGFCRSNLFKRLESSGSAFLLSIERHIIRNYIFIYALENGLDIPIGTLDAVSLDADSNDRDTIFDLFEEEALEEEDDETEDDDDMEEKLAEIVPSSEEGFRKRAKMAYEVYFTKFKRKFQWINSRWFVPSLIEDLTQDAESLLDLLERCPNWDASKDQKLFALADLITNLHPDEKILVFTQFADTARYLGTELSSMGITKLAVVTGTNHDPTSVAYQFSPVSNDKRKDIPGDKELRVVIATDVLSEGQNLQDCAIVVNYDLPWAIIRLIQRAGRVDRIGQKASTIQCYSFLPAEGVNRIIRLRDRLRQRLDENADVVGTDEQFFEDDGHSLPLHELYNENSTILDGDTDTEVDLASYAYQIWNNAISADPSLKKKITELPSVVYSTKHFAPKTSLPEGVLVYLRTGDGTDALAWMNKNGQSVTESQFTILQAACCLPDTPALIKMKEHHVLVKEGMEKIAKTEEEQRNQHGGQLGRKSSARFKTYERLKSYSLSRTGSSSDMQNLNKVIQDIYRYPLKQNSIDILNSKMREGISDEMLAQTALLLWEDDRLCIATEDEPPGDPQIICSMGLVNTQSNILDLNSSEDI